MVKIITALEARFIQYALESSLDILRQEGYDDEAKDVNESLKILRGLTERDIEEVIK